MWYSATAASRVTKQGSKIFSNELMRYSP